ncbi:MAG: O-antigen ligase family protein [Luteolibacter sp.]|uniref:O-antigen ligase family protein n=1 Tax=Luteolibacter sp. TaxID=1962973 RepID=UPI003265EBA9
MPVISSVFLVLSLVLAVVIGPQTRAWTWGPSLLALGVASAAALPAIWKKGRIASDFGRLACGTLVAGWFAWRAWISPVPELGQMDLMLLCGVVAAFVCVRVIHGNAMAEHILIWGIALLLLASVLVIWKQVVDPAFSPVFASRASALPSGFYAHYNEAANYLIASSLLVAALALFGNQGVLVRLIWALIAIAGLVAVYFTRSRGGIFGAAVGGGVFTVVALVIAKRRKVRWFLAAMLAVPITAFLLGGYLYVGWKDAQALRLQESGNISGSGIEQMMDNDSRLYLLGIATSSIALHPLSGGGSQSFSWESFRFYNNKLQGGTITHKAELVHNELMEAATDYGIIGAGMLLGLLVALTLTGILGVVFSDSRMEGDSGDAWILGGLAALAGMLIQSCFSFVFHLLPGGVLLGICLGLISRSSGRPADSPQVIGSRILLTTAAAACAVFLLPMGWRGTRTTHVLWSSYFSKQPLTSFESRSEALGEALRLWPTSSIYQERAFAYQEASSVSEGTSSKEMAELAIADYEEAERLHPFDPSPVVNRANVLSRLHRDHEAEDAYDHAITLQGGMEPGFRGRFSLAKHLMSKGLRQFNPEYPADSLSTVEIAAQQMEEAVKEMHWITPDMRDPRVSVQESLGAAKEANGDYEGAMRAYDFATMLISGNRAHYRAGILNGKIAASAWAERRSAEAMGYFIEARRRIGLAKELPQGVTPSQQIEYLAYLDQAITYLKGAKIEPIAPKN